MSSFQRENFDKNVTKIFRIILSLLYVIHFFLNYISSPLTNFSILLITIVTLFSIIFSKNDFSLISLILFSFVEGQGRVLWSYNPFFRIVFDLYCFVFILKLFGQNKKYIIKENIPVVCYIFFLLHILWFLLNLFNPYGAGPIYAFAAIKYYIFPPLLFFSFLNLKELKEVAYLQRIGFYIVCLSVATIILCSHQMSVGEESVYKISNNYQNLFDKYKGFTEAFFRPWGTSHVAGGMAIYLFLTVGFIFLFYSMKGKAKNLFWFLIVILGSWFTLFICQVRSAMIKHLLIFITVSYAYVLTAKFRARYLALGVIGAILMVIISFKFIDQFDTITKELNLDFAIKRYEVLLDRDNEKSSGGRGGVDHIYNRIVNDTNWPFGFGPGMLTSFLPRYEERRKELTEIDPVRFWAGDNLYLFLFLEMGIGALLYIGLIYSAPMVIIYKLYVNSKSLSKVQRRLAIMSVFIMMIIITGNWVAIGICFNPESFYYWLWAAIGVKSSEAFVEVKPS